MGAGRDGARPLLLGLLHLVQEAHDALQLGLGEQSAPVWQGGVEAQLPVALQVVCGQRVGVSVLWDRWLQVISCFVLREASGGSGAPTLTSSIQAYFSFW